MFSAVPAPRHVKSDIYLSRPDAAVHPTAPTSARLGALAAVFLVPVLCVKYLDLRYSPAAPQSFLGHSRQ